MLNPTLIELSFAEFEDDPDLYVLKPLQYVGIEVWQVPNIIVGQTHPITVLGCIKCRKSYLNLLLS
jgi:hypothetical protein